MVAYFKKIKAPNNPVNAHEFDYPSRHAKDATLASYKAQKRETEPLFDREISPEDDENDIEDYIPKDDLESLLYEMSTDGAPNGLVYKQPSR